MKKNNLCCILFACLLTSGTQLNLFSQCQTWQNPTPTTGWEDFNALFGGAPVDDGSGCPFNQITAFEIFAAEAYSIDNFVMGTTYTFSFCNSPGGQGTGGAEWPVELTILTPTGAVDAFGLNPGSNCALSWTATESGTYQIVINEQGQCGGGSTTTKNGYPAITCGPLSPCQIWQKPTPTTGWEDFNAFFGGAPVNDGSGCPFNQLTAFEIFAAEAYSIDNFVMGTTYTFSFCNSPGGQGTGGTEWPAELTILTPSGEIDASGLDPGSICELTWTASESGTYLIVINEQGQCGGGSTTTKNGYPAITCLCEAPVAICQDATVQLDDVGNAMAQAGIIDAGSTTDCELMSEIVYPNLFDCMTIGTNIVTYTITDVNNSGSSCTATLTVEDNIPPVAACFQPTINFDGEAELSLMADDVWDQNSSSDNCGTVNFVSLSPEKIICDQIGNTIAVTIIVEDESGNQATCVANVTVDGSPCGWSASPEGINCPGGNQASYDSDGDTFSITSEGCYDPAFYSNMDAHGFVGTQLCGDGEIIAEVVGVAGNGFAGVSIREDLSADSKMLQLGIDGVFLTKREMRLSTGGLAFNHLFQTQGKNWLRLTRSSSQFTAQHSTDGINWAPVIITTIFMNNCVEIGLYTENNWPTGSMTATFGNVTILQASSLSTPLQFHTDTALEWNQDFSIFPNPAKDRIYLNLESFLGQKIEIVVSNAQGQVLHTIKNQEQTTALQLLDLSLLPSGNYFVVLQTANIRISKKLIKMD